MRCTGYCTASSYDIPRLFYAIQKYGPAHLYRDLIHVQIKDGDTIRGDIFCFSYGVIIAWGFTAEEETVYLHELKNFEREPLLKPELDEFTFCYGDMMKIEEDEITLQNKNVLTRIAISQGIAQSVKLTTFEELIQKTIDHTKHLPNDLARKGKISLSRKEISRKMGELFIERNFINLHTEVLDTPEFFWEHPEFEPFYRRTSHYLDVSKRVEILNKRLNIIHELFEILTNELNHQHSSRLEWTIIILIIIEVALAVFHDILKWI
ncbi:MAG: RMD1 family protein [Chlamydiota bacterium]